MKTLELSLLIFYLLVLLVLAVPLAMIGASQLATGAYRVPPTATSTPGPVPPVELVALATPTTTLPLTPTVVVTAPVGAPTSPLPAPAGSEPTPPTLPEAGAPSPLPAETPTETPTPPPTPAGASSQGLVMPGIPPGAQSAEVVEVLAGDAVDVLVEGNVETVAYLGIEAPLIGQPGFQAASEANRTLTAAGLLYLVADQTDRDADGNLLRYVYTPEGVFVNASLVAQGWAQPAEVAPDTAHVVELRQLAREAAEAGRGFWSGSSPYDGVMPLGLLQNVVSLMAGPGPDFGVTMTADSGTTVVLLGQNPAGDWLQVRLPNGIVGWTPAASVRSTAPPGSLPIVQS